MKRSSPYLKMRVLGAIEHAPGMTIRARIKHVSTMTFKDEDQIPHTFTWRTIQTWYSHYQKHGVTSLHNKQRADKGRLRKVSPEEVAEAIEQALPHFYDKGYNMAALYQQCIKMGTLRREKVAPNTFRRIVADYELLTSEDKLKSKKRLAFAKAHANEMWQADTMMGPYVQTKKGKVQAKLIAFIDDASRVCCHGEFFASENTDSLIKALRSALYKRGVPLSMYVDNGSIYTSLEITQICARLGTLLCHAPVRDGAAKGKVERFFRTVRMNFLTKSLDLSNIETLNRQFTEWVEGEYHAREHSVLKMKPIDRFGLDLSRIVYLTPNEVNDELFFVEQTRCVIADNTFSLKGKRFEAPRDLRSRKVAVRFDRRNFGRAIVYYKGERMGEAKHLDFEANDRPAKRVEVEA